MHNINLDDLLFTPCIFCHKSQEQAMCDILIDNKCGVNICASCFRFKKDQLCQKCPLKIKDHHKKIKNNKKELLLQESTKMYEREFKIRSNWEDLDAQLVNILTYYYKKKRGNDFDKKQSELKVILEQMTKKQKSLMVSLRNNNRIQFLDYQSNEDGKQACGYENSNKKGIKFLFQSFI